MNFNLRVIVFISANIVIKLDMKKAYKSILEIPLKGFLDDEH